MRTLSRYCLFLLLVVATASNVWAADEKKAKKGKKGQAGPMQQVLKKLDALNLTPEQKKKLGAIRKEHGPKLAEVQKKMTGAIPADLRKARAAAGKKARAEGKKGKELQEAIAAAAPLTDEQKTAVAEVEDARKSLLADLRAAVSKILTDEQRAEFAPARKKGKKAAKKAA